MKDTVFEKIYTQVKRIPKGKVASYGLVAAMAGNPRWARVVGYALHVNPYPGEVPCHRVVKKVGSLAGGFAFGGEGAQRRLLEGEGVTFLPDGRVEIVFDEPVRALTVGQAVVLYDNDQVIGGGTITEVIKK